MEDFFSFAQNEKGYSWNETWYRRTYHKGYKKGHRKSPRYEGFLVLSFKYYL